MYALDGDPRVVPVGDALVRTDDRASALMLCTVRMLRPAPRPLTVDELYGGVQRYWRLRPARLPTVEVYTAWLAAQPWLERAADVVSLGAGLTPGQVAASNVAGTDLLVAAVQGAEGASWSQLMAALTSTGVLPETAKMAAYTSPVLVRMGPNLYRLRGAR